MPAQAPGGGDSLPGGAGKVGGVATLRDAPPPSDPAPGWKPDPMGGSGFRYWNGLGWTAEVSQAEAGPRSGARAPDEVPEEDPKPLGTRAWVAIAALALTIPANLWVIFADLAYIDVIDRILDGRSVGFAEAEDATDDVDASGTLWAILRFATIVAFLFWFARAYYNLPRFGLAELRYGRGWSIGAWFVPILNLFRPKQIADDVWRGSEALREGEPAGWRERPVAGLVHWWWGLLLLGSALGWIVSRIILGRGEDLTAQGAFDALEDERLAFYIDLASSLVEIPAALLAIAMIRAVTRVQTLVQARAGESTRIRSTA